MMRELFLIFSVTGALAATACGGVDPKDGGGAFKKPFAADAVAKPNGFDEDDPAATGGVPGGDGAADANGGAAGPNGGGADGGGGTGAAPVTPSEPVPPTLVEAFRTTVFPVLRANCKGCHERVQTPFFASLTPEAALQAIQDTGKVNFEEIENSRIVKRLVGDNHNCWSECPTDAETMRLAIQTWKDLVKKEDEKPKIETSVLLMEQSVERDKATDPATMAAEAELGTLTAPMVMSTNTNASASGVISVPAVGGAAAINNPNTANIGSVVYTFDVKTAGTYSVFGLVNAPTAAANRFFVRIDAGAFTTWTITMNADKFVWTRVQSGAAAPVPLTAVLTAGTHTVEVRRSRPGTNLDMIALTSNANFDGSQAVLGKIKVLRYDLSTLLNSPGVFFEIEMEDFSEGAYKFRNPRIVSPTVKVRAKGIRVQVNGTYDPQHNTYNFVDKTVAAPGDLLSPAAMVVIKDQGAETDQITFTFDALEVVP